MREKVVQLLREMAEAMRHAGDRTRYRAYARAAESIEKRKDFDELYARKRLQSITGVGPSIEKKVVDFVERGARPDWLDDPSKMPRKLGSSVTSARSVWNAAREELVIPQAYYDAPFADAPDLHIHTTWSDGAMPLEDVVAWARELGAPAVGITDHSGSLRIAHGLRPEEVREQWLEIEKVQGDHPDILILKGTECDILRDGSLDHPPEILEEFDYVIGSLHSQLKLDKKAQTERVLAALDSPHLTILGHPTTRVPGRRPPAELDLEAIFEKAAKRGVALEINGNPGRIDLDIPLAKKALEAGCKLSCGSDGHSAHEMLAFAMARLMAEQAGATKDDLINYGLLDGRLPAATAR